ncbi:MAG: hypothetical protein Q8R72_17325 [Hylemonella sp.]|nr:hypothetical protein [Hylemonella sp.]
MARESEVEWWLKYILGFLVVLVAILVALNFSRLHMYQTYFGQASPEVAMRYELLSPSMDEAAVRRHFEGMALNCVAENTGMGDRVCYAAVDMADGVPALGVALFFRKGRLNQSVVQVPWWRHLRQKQRLLALHGEPQLQQQPGETPLLAWRMPHGLLVFNQDRISDLNPLSWSVVMWHARQ